MLTPLSNTMETKPTVSVIITCRNLEAYLDEAVDSVKGQTVQPYEVVLCHDSCEHPKAYADITTIIRDKHLGVAKTRDEGVRLAKGEWLLFLDADDMLAENYVQECLKHTDKADIIYPDVLLWCYWGKEAPKQNVYRKAPTKIDKKLMLHHNEVLISSLMKRDVYRKVGPFDASLPIFEDWDYFLRALMAGFSFKRANTYLKYRQRTNSRNRQSKDIRQEVIKQIRSRYQGHL